MCLQRGFSPQPTVQTQHLSTSIRVQVIKLQSSPHKDWSHIEIMWTCHYSPVQRPHAERKQRALDTRRRDHRSVRFMDFTIRQRHGNTFLNLHAAILFVITWIKRPTVYFLNLLSVYPPRLQQISLAGAEIRSEPPPLFLPAHNYHA